MGRGSETQSQVCENCKSLTLRVKVQIAASFVGILTVSVDTLLLACVAMSTWYQIRRYLSSHPISIIIISTAVRRQTVVTFYL